MNKLYKYISFISSVALLGSCSLADGTGLDVTDYGTEGANAKMPGNAVYMSSSSSAILLDDKNGASVILSPALVSPMDQDVTVTMSLDPTALDEYNVANNLTLQPIDGSLVSFVSDSSEDLGSQSVEVVIPAGSISASATVKVAAMDPEKYSYSTKYALPVRITQNGAGLPILSSPNYAVVSLNRPFKTDVLHINRMNGGMVITMNEPVKENLTQWTFQAQFHYSALERNDVNVASPNQTVVNVSGGGLTMEWYTRIAYKGGIQIKRGRDGDDMWTQAPLKDHEWINLTFVYREVSAAENTGRVEVYYGTELVKTFDEKTTPSYTWKAGASPAQWTVGGANYGDDYVREVKMWNRALTVAEIQDKLYLPEDPKSEGLVLYYPLTKASFDEEANTFIDMTGNSTMTLPSVFNFDFLDNVVLPNTSIVTQ